MPDVDLFVVFRRLLLVFGTTYSLVKLASLVGRVRAWLGDRDTRIVLLRDYICAQLAEIRPRRLAADVLEIAVLAAVFVALVFCHRLVP